MPLIVGLGNPGTRYRRTRHNAGALFLDFFAAARGATFSSEKKFHGQIALLSQPGIASSSYLLKPGTYMNHSGLSVAAVQRFYQYAASNIVIIHDDLELPLGQVRLKEGGGHGGHNGLRDIMQCLGAQDFLRLRIGIGRPEHKSGVSDYVLSPFSASEHFQIEQAFSLVEAHVVDCLAAV